MKSVSRILAILCLLAVMLMALPLTAAADTQSFTGIVGNAESFWFYLDYDDIVESASIDNGAVPGMALDYPNPAAVALSGTPTQAGSYTLYVSVYTQREGWLQYTLNVTIERAPEVKPTETQPPETKPTEAPPATEAPKKPEKPKITKNPTGERVVEGESATFIARAENVKKYVWEISIADGVLDCADLPGYIGGGIGVSGANGETLVLSNIPTKLNEAYVRCKFVGENESVYSEYAKITVIAQKDATPVVTKDPTDETIDEGGEMTFVAKAKYAQTYTWKLVSPDGKQTLCKEAGKIFDGLKVTGADTERIILSNVPAELDGYQIYCEFTAGTTVSGGKATIHVNPKPTEATTAPTTEPAETKSTEAPTEATAAPTRETEAPTEAPAPTEPAAKESGGGTGLIITIIISLTMVAVAAIGAVVFLRMKGKL